MQLALRPLASKWHNQISNQASVGPRVHAFYHSKNKGGILGVHEPYLVQDMFYLAHTEV